MASGGDVRRRRKRSGASSTGPQGGGHKKSRGKAKGLPPVWLQTILVLFVAIIALCAVVLVYPSDYVCQTYELPEPPSLEGPLAVNDVLTNAEYILHNQILGPESVLVENGTIYTGTQEGTVVMIEDGKVQRTIRFKEGPCGNYEQEPNCGRPLGIRRLNANELIVMDAYLGIFTINFHKGTFKQILDSQREIEGERPMFLNDVDVVHGDLVVFTHSSSRWQRRDFMKVSLEGIPNGRVCSLVPSTGKVKVLLKNLYFANGIQLFPDKQSFIVAETTMARIKRHWLSGPKSGKTEIFAGNLPGLPDNIRLGSDGSFWVGMAGVRRGGSFSLVDFLAERTILRKMLLKLMPDAYWVPMYNKMKPPHAMILKLGNDGQILSSAHDPNGVRITDISQVYDDGKHLYMGSYHAKFIAKLDKRFLTSSS